jgi:cysteinyl-tRNA synthetase
MALKLYNTLSGQKDEFKPLLADEARIYSCGPTVYNFAHIGNLRAYVFADTLKRAILWQGFKVKHVVNITDIGHLTSDSDTGEDKMTQALKREGKSLTLESMKELALFYEKAFIKDITSLNILLPDVMPRASEHIEEDIQIINILLTKKMIYRTSDGLYFDTTKFAQYGKLGGFHKTVDKKTARIENNPEKKNQRDFAVWKFNNQIGFEGPWGKGFPGWHIECSAMSRKYLNQPFDIHTGGVDHIGTHHNNEIAQSESAFGTPLAMFWLHNEHMNLKDGSKMAKSSGQFITLNYLREKGFEPIHYRYYLLGAHYRTPMRFSLEALEAVTNSYKRLLNILRNMPDGGKIHKDSIERFNAAIEDDINSPEALAILWETIKNENISLADKKRTVLKFDEFLGLNLAEGIKNEEIKQIDEIPQEINDLILARENARKSMNWKEADRLREIIEQRGYKIIDLPEGSRLYKI